MHLTSTRSDKSKINPVIRYRLKTYEPRSCIQRFSFMLIRPPRFVYNEDILNPMPCHKTIFTYECYDIPFPLSVYSVANMRYVILYLHGNTSSRFQGYMHLNILPEQVGLACFDFDGCGLREEKEFISLGKHQAKDIDRAVKFLKEEKGYVVVGWGRSMGAVSLLLSSQCDIMIADSPFASLSRLCKELAARQVSRFCICCFHCLFPCFFCLVASDVNKKTAMHPSQLQIAEHLHTIQPDKSILLLAGQQDMLIPSKNTQQLYESYRGKDKKIILFEGTHNSQRPDWLREQCFEFIEQALLKRGKCGKRIMEKLELSRINSSNQEDGIQQTRATMLRRVEEEVRHTLYEQPMMERNNCSKMIKQDIQMIELEQGEEIEFDGISIKTKVSSPRKKIEHSVEKQEGKHQQQQQQNILSLMKEEKPRLVLSPLKIKQHIDVPPKLSLAYQQLPVASPASNEVINTVSFPMQDSGNGHDIYHKQQKIPIVSKQPKEDIL